MTTNGNLPFAIIAGLAGAIVGALIWMGVTVATGYQVGYVAVGIGALVGFLIRWAGHGTQPVFGMIGAAFTLLGCVVGQALAAVQIFANQSGMGFMEAFSHADVAKLAQGVFENASPITYFIYAIGLYEGYKLSILRVAPTTSQARRRSFERALKREERSFRARRFPCKRPGRCPGLPWFAPLGLRLLSR